METILNQSIASSRVEGFVLVRHCALLCMIHSGKEISIEEQVKDQEVRKLCCLDCMS